MIKIIIIIAALLAGLILGPEISANKGYILLSVDGYTTYETTIINAILIAFIFYFLLLFIEWLLRKLLSMSSITRNWFSLRKTRQAQKTSSLGMFALLEGDNKQAQILLGKSAERSDSPALTYIAAAKAAHYQGKYKLRDEYFEQASEGHKSSQLAVGLAQAELYLDTKEYERALTVLRALEKNNPKNNKIFEFYTVIYPALHQWKNYIELLNRKRNTSSFSDDELADMRFDAYRQLFIELAVEGEDVLQLFWNKKLSRWMRKQPNYQEALVNAHLEAGNSKFVEQFLLEKLNKDFSSSLLFYLEKLQLSDYYPLILVLEKKLESESEKGLIHQALAHLLYKEDKVVAAIKHLQESVKTVPNTKDFLLLAELLQKEDRDSEANEYYRLGLVLATSLN